MYDWQAKEVTISHANDSKEVKLDALTCNHYIVFEANSDFISIGLSNKLVCCAAVKDVQIEETTVKIELEETGDFIAYCAKEVKRITNNEAKNLPFTHANSTLRIQATCKTINVFFT